MATFLFSPNNPPDAPVANLAVNLDASGSTDSSGTITAYHWTIGSALYGGGSPSATSLSGAMASVSFSGPGVFPVSVTVTNNGGQSATSNSQDIFVSGPGSAANTLAVACQGTGGSVDINVPSYAQNPNATLASDLQGCQGRDVDPASLQVNLVPGPASGAGPSTDAWGKPANHVHVTFVLSGTPNGGTSGSAGVVVAWS